MATAILTRIVDTLEQSTASFQQKKKKACFFYVENDIKVKPLLRVNQIHDGGK